MPLKNIRRNRLVSKLSPSNPNAKTATVRGLRMDDIGAATKQNEVYGRTRIPVGPLQVPFPGNFLFFKYLPGIRKWGPYDELTPAVWAALFQLLKDRSCPLTIGITASWVEDSGALTPFPKKFPEQAKLLKQAADEGLIEIANHGLTHCVLQDSQFKPRLFSSNRTAHREFWDWIPPETHRENIQRSQNILQDYFARPVTTLIPPGNVYQHCTVQFARESGIRTLSCKTPTRFENDIAFVGDEDLLPFHDREIALEEVDWLTNKLESIDASTLRFIRDLGDQVRQTGSLRL